MRWRRAAIRVTRVDVGRDVAEVLARLKPDVAFNALHGPFGEDGCIQGILEILGIPYTHSGVLASALAMNKPKAKDVMKAAGIPVAECIAGQPVRGGQGPRHGAALCGQAAERGVELRRPHRQGGRSRTRRSSSIADDWPYGDIVMVERYVAGRELTCGGARRRGARCH